MNSQSSAPRRKSASGGMDLNELFDNFGKEDPGPDWRVPNAFYIKEAEQFVRSGYEQNGLKIDQAVALHLLKFEYEGDFLEHRKWYEGVRSLVESPGETCPGMNEAGQTLAKAIDKNHKIAVYCDYDVDGTSAGEALRLGLAPYGADLHFGYADAQAGFGLTNDFVQEAKAEGAKVLITLDCGSKEVDQAQLAKDLNMTVIVVDHHSVNPENPATHHLNPKLHEPLTSDNTGAQLAWKLAAAVQIAKEGKARPEHWERAMNVAGMGALADMASVSLPENRAFFWSAVHHPAPGVVALARQMGENPLVPGSLITTQACMNLPKRTSLVDAKEIGALFAAENEEAAMPIVEKLVAAYEAAKPVKKDMAEQALAQTGVAIRHDNGDIDRPFPAISVAYAVIDNHPDYAGYTGPVASSVSGQAGKPAIVFARKRDGTYKFSLRDSARTQAIFGELIENEELRAACVVERQNEAGETVSRPSLGGHAGVSVVSGSCKAENIEEVVRVINEWADEKVAKKKYWPKTWDGPEATVVERKVSPDRLPTIELQAARFGPFSRNKQDTVATKKQTADSKKKANTELQISMEGTLSELVRDEENPDSKWLKGTLSFANGDSRDVRFPEDIPAPEPGTQAEWVLRVGTPGEYYLRTFYQPKK